MKRLLSLAILALALSISAYAQGETDAFNLSFNDQLKGTARGVAMGGAFGALGGDATGVAINPAGIGVYRSSEIVTTMGLTNTNAQTNFLGTKSDKDKFSLNFDNFAIVGSYPLYSDKVPVINLGFAFNKIKSFDRKVSATGYKNPFSLTDYITDMANIVGSGNILPDDAYAYSGNWLPILGYDAGLTQYDKNNKNFYSPLHNGEKVNSRFNMRERGHIHSFDFSAGTTISNMLSIGATVSLTNINYRLSSTHSEDFYESGKAGEGFDLHNTLKTTGDGYQIKAGFIFKPVHELRIGFAYHSPTWYKLNDYYYADVEKKFYTEDGINDKGAGTPEGVTGYKLRTPDKWVFSLAGVLGQNAIFSVDYELTNYSNMNLSGRDGDDYYYQGANEYIKEDYKNASTIRFGAEFRVTPQLSARFGYKWQQSPLEKSFKQGLKEVPATGTVPHYTLVGDANYITWGLGYKFKPVTGTNNYFYTDVAFLVKSRKDDLYTFSRMYNDNGETVIDNDPIKLKNRQFSGVFSVGFRF